ncbi:efflux RND transporter permease subunit [Litoribrevibacter albus]|uniref:Membrane protein n=1 Tax=Litoribrevibacter albus TaxID=1473156 RepID=A0AA37S7L8_9GAMM|nr:MMPL family transporter [Litoribrevibacter albus]GLQ29732.1 membrane protein [Litoribrevibacter albus]
MFSFYRSLVLSNPRLWLLIILGLSVLAVISGQSFKIDASADSLTLENDKDLKYFRDVVKEFGADDFLFITYAPKNDSIVSDKSLNEISLISTKLEALNDVSSVVSILNVPLLDSPRISLTELSQGMRTLATPGVNKELALKEFQNSPLYNQLLMSEDAKTTALQVNLKRDTEYYRLLNARNELRNASKEEGFSKQADMAHAEAQFSEYNAARLKRESQTIADVRAILDQHREHADIFLGGVTMITSDMISFIEDDLVTFGIGVVLFLIAMLTVIFRKVRWVLVPLLSCLLTSIWLVGLLALLDWRATVISSNFVSLVLIITMSMCVHLVVRYRELHLEMPKANQFELVESTTLHMIKPCLYTSLTTIVAFMSLVFSGIKPVIDFGWMMATGVGLAFLLTFIIFPVLMLLIPVDEPVEEHDFTEAFTLFFAGLAKRRYVSIAFISLGLAAGSIFGITKLEVENSFIGYFDDKTEIYQGMSVIDQELGGTTPLDIVIKPDQQFDEFVKSLETPFEAVELEGDDFLEDEMGEELGDLDGLGDAFGDMGDGFGEADEANAPSYWLTTKQLARLKEIHQYLESYPEIGKVLSLSTVMDLATMLNDDKPLSDFELALVRTMVPEDVSDILIKPYLSDDANTARITMRIIDSDPELRRAELLEKIQTDLQQKFGLEVEQYRLTNMMVLYNNMLQSLFTSQIETLGVVFLAIMLMFWVLFRSFYLAVVAIIPNMLAAGMVLGAMGLAGLPLDMMTITIAAITVGIAVDDTIHYIHRFMEEFPKDYDYKATIVRCHGSIGKAMYYTSVIIVVGFSILALSNFVPTIYFGILTGLAMVAAIFAALTLLPSLILLCKPVGNGDAQKARMATESNS